MANYKSKYTGAQIDSHLDKVDTNEATITALSSQVENKQEKLVSGTNIKTINNQPILGSGNIDIQGGGGTSVFDLTPYITEIAPDYTWFTITQEGANKVNNSDFVTFKLNDLLFSCLTIGMEQGGQKIKILCTYFILNETNPWVIIGPEETTPLKYTFSSDTFPITIGRYLDGIAIFSTIGNKTIGKVLPVATINGQAIIGATGDIHTPGFDNPSIYTPPSDGTYVLKAINGYVEWVKEI